MCWSQDSHIICCANTSSSASWLNWQIKPFLVAFLTPHKYYCCVMTVWFELWTENYVPFPFNQRYIPLCPQQQLGRPSALHSASRRRFPDWFRLMTFCRERDSRLRTFISISWSESLVFLLKCWLVWQDIIPVKSPYCSFPSRTVHQ